MGDDAVVTLSISQFFRNQCVDAVALLRARWCALLSAVRLDPARWLLRDTSRWSLAAFCPDNGVWRVVRRNHDRPFGAAAAAHRRAHHRGLRIGHVCLCRSQMALLGWCASANLPARSRDGNYRSTADVDSDG